MVKKKFTKIDSNVTTYLNSPTFRKALGRSQKKLPPKR